MCWWLSVLGPVGAGRWNRRSAVMVFTSSLGKFCLTREVWEEEWFLRSLLMGRLWGPLRWDAARVKGGEVASGRSRGGIEVIPSPACLLCCLQSAAMSTAPLSAAALRSRSMQMLGLLWHFQAIRGVASMGKPNSSPYHGRCVFSTVVHGAGIYFHFLNHAALLLSSCVFSPNRSGVEEFHSCPAGCSQLMNKQIYAKAGQHSAVTCFQCFYSGRSQIF